MSSRTSTSMAPSWRCPPVSTIANGIPLPSTAAWILLPSPPRERPIACPSGSSGDRLLWFAVAPCGLVRTRRVGAVLMSSVDRRVHRDHPLDIARGIGLRHQRGMDPVPNTEAGVEVMALPHRLPGTELLTGKIPPRDPGPGAVDDPLDDLAVVVEGTPFATRVRGQHRLDSLPLLVSEDLVPRSRRGSHPSTFSHETAHT